jgi:probable phosphoglycerate mutase
MLLPLLLAAQVAAEAARQTPADLPPAGPNAVRVFLVRHGQALTNLDPTPDLPPEKLDRLTDLGHQQARRAGEALRRVRLERVLTSPAGRARETAADIGTLLGLPVEVDTRLRSLEVGAAPASYEDPWDFRIAEWEAGRDPTPEGGESMQAMGRRVLDLVRSLSARPGRSVVLVAHSEVIGAFLGELAGTPPAQRWPPAVPNGSISVVDVERDERPRVRLQAFVPPPPR